MRCIFVILITLVVMFSFVAPAAAGNTICIYYAGPEVNSVYTALTLVPEGTFTFVNDPSQATYYS
jgi:hypothetical protein